MTHESIPLTNFESIKNNIGRNNTNIDNSTAPVTSAPFFDLLKQNDELNIFADDVFSDIDNMTTNSDSMSKNITFRSIITTLKLAIKEYKYQKILFQKYINSHNEMNNEDSVVRILELIRQVISDRRVILNDITNNLLKLQKLDNDRIKIDLAPSDDLDDIDELLSPDTL
jgi:hypothetical protein